MATDTLPTPVRAAVFHDASQAEEVVRQLEQLGFSTEQITVVCSDPATEARFRNYEHQEPAGFYSTRAVTLGGVSGAAVGAGLALLVALATGAGAIMFAAAGLCILTGAIVGGFIGEMVTRAAEKELANFYSEEVQPGEILVAVEAHQRRAAPLLEAAEQVFQRAGARPLELPEG